MNKNFLAFIICGFLFPSLSNAAEIAWHKSNVDQALSQAKTEHKPIMVYWGAVWCPPCEALKVHVFPDPKFIDATKNFVAIYLDGDTQDAQIWGEKFGATGYPTLIVLNEDGQEVQRLGTSQTAADLTKDLLQAGQNSQTIEQLLEQVVAEKYTEKILQQSWQRIAHHGWDYNPKWDDRKEELTKKLVIVQEKVPNIFSNEKTALQLLVLGRRIESVSAPEKLDAKIRTDGLELVSKIIADQKSMMIFKKEMIFGAEKFTKGFFPEPGDNKTAMIQFVMAYKQAMWKLLEEKSLTLQQRGYILSGISELSSGQNPEYPVLLAVEQKRLKQTLLKYLTSAKIAHERVVIFNVLPYVYKKLGLVDEARKLILKYENQVGVKNLIYTLLADLDMDEGQLESALTWSEKAYKTSKGSATRTQWGNNYMQVLVEVSPEKSQQIWDSSLAIISEGLSVKDGLSGRNARSLKKLKTAITGWAEKQKQEFPISKLAQIEKEKCNGEAEFVKKCQDYFKAFSIAKAK